MTASAFLARLEAATREADAAEEEVRADFARRIAFLADERAVAYRRFNLLRALHETVERAVDAETAAVYGLASLRTRLGWADGEQGVRTEIAERFAPVCRALWEAGRDRPVGKEVGETADAALELAAFEEWYRDRVGSDFWLLFENHMPETPRVDF